MKYFWVVLLTVGTGFYLFLPLAISGGSLQPQLPTDEPPHADFENCYGTTVPYGTCVTRSPTPTETVTPTPTATPAHATKLHCLESQDYTCPPDGAVLNFSGNYSGNWQSADSYFRVVAVDDSGNPVPAQIRVEIQTGPDAYSSGMYGVDGGSFFFAISSGDSLNLATWQAVHQTGVETFSEAVSQAGPCLPSTLCPSDNTITDDWTAGYHPYLQLAKQHPANISSLATWYSTYNFIVSLGDTGPTPVPATSCPPQELLGINKPAAGSVCFSGEGLTCENLAHAADDSNITYARFVKTELLFSSTRWDDYSILGYFDFYNVVNGELKEIAKKAESDYHVIDLWYSTIGSGKYRVIASVVNWQTRQTENVAVYDTAPQNQTLRHVEILIPNAYSVLSVAIQGMGPGTWEFDVYSLRLVLREMYTTCTMPTLTPTPTPTGSATPTLSPQPTDRPTASVTPAEWPTSDRRPVCTMIGQPTATVGAWAQTRIAPTKTQSIATRTLSAFALTLTQQKRDRLPTTTTTPTGATPTPNNTITQTHTPTPSRTPTNTPIPSATPTLIQYGLICTYALGPGTSCGNDALTPMYRRYVSGSQNAVANNNKPSYKFELVNLSSTPIPWATAFPYVRGAQSFSWQGLNSYSFHDKAGFYQESTARNPILAYGSCSTGKTGSCDVFTFGDFQLTSLVGATDLTIVWLQDAEASSSTYNREWDYEIYLFTPTPTPIPTSTPTGTATQPPTTTPTGAPTSTPGPTSTWQPTAAPTLECRPRDSVPRVEFTPPQLTHKSCWLISPQFTVGTPAIFGVWQGGDVGFPGLRLCVQFFTLRLVLFGFDWFGVLVTIVDLTAFMLLLTSFRREN